MATGVQVWSQVAATNASADGNQNWAEGMAPSQINDSARAGMASVAKWRDDNSGSLVTAGTTTAFTITSNQVSTGNTNGYTIAAKFHATADASATLSVDGQTAANIQSVAGTNIIGQEIQANTIAKLTYISGSTAWVIQDYNQYGNLTVSGTATITGATAITGAVTASSAVTVSGVATFNSTVTAAGSVTVTTASTANILTIPRIRLDTGTKTATTSGLTATLNTNSGTITTTALTNAGGATLVIVHNNTAVTTSDIILATLSRGTATGDNVVMLVETPSGAGVINYNLHNNSGSALNGSYIINFGILKQ